MTTAEPDATPLFQAVLVPHRSLSRRGLYTLIGCICGSSAIISTLFFLLGAWPVAGFSGAEVGLALLMLRLHARAARRSELILLTPGLIRILRTDAQGQTTERRLDASWLNVVLEERNARVPALLLASRSAQQEIARDLGEAAKRELATSLAAALHHSRHPVFDNPQLRHDA